MNKLLSLTPFIFLIFITGCNKKVTIKDLCKNNPTICQTLVADTWCKKERKNVLIHYDRFNRSYQDSDRYQVLLKLEDYRECMGVASQIEHVKLKFKQTKRINNTEQAKKEITKLVNESKQSQDPHMLFYRWSRFLEKKAINQLLILEGTPEIETPELQLIFATYYTKTDQHKTLSYLFHALELYKEGDDINIEMFKSLITIFTDKKEYKQAYIWLKVLNLYAPADKNSNEENLLSFQKHYQLRGDFLDKVANTTLNKIQEGTFVAPKF